MENRSAVGKDQKIRIWEIYEQSTTELSFFTTLFGSAFTEYQVLFYWNGMFFISFMEPVSFLKARHVIEERKEFKLNKRQVAVELQLPKPEKFIDNLFEMQDNIVNILITNCLGIYRQAFKEQGMSTERFPAIRALKRLKPCY